MFKTHKVYIQIRRNQITAINLNTGEETSRLAIRPFSTQRIVLASFDPANETVIIEETKNYFKNELVTDYFVLD